MNTKTFAKKLKKVRGNSLLAPAAVADRFISSLEDLLESIEYASPRFWKEIELSRHSGRVSSRAIEKSLGL